MVYSGVEMEAEEYFVETEQYIERFFGNRISDYDLEKGFPRVNSALKGFEFRAITNEYQPKGYKIPEESPFTTHEIAMLGYLAVGMPDIIKPEEIWTEENSLSDEEKEIAPVYNDAVGVNERAMCLDSFFTGEPRYTAGKRGEEMTRAYDYTKAAIQKNDLDSIAKICKEGLIRLQKGEDCLRTAKGIDRYADCYVCTEILKMIEKYPELQKKVQISPEDMNYYKGLQRLGEIIRKGEIAKDKLDAGEQLPENERQYLEGEKRRYVALSTMIFLEYDNIMESTEVQERNMKCMMIATGPKWREPKENTNIAKQFEHLIVAGGTGCRPMGTVIQQLGECPDVETFMDAITEKIENARQTGVIPEFKNLKNVQNLIIDAEKSMIKNSIDNELSEKRKKERTVRENAYPYEKEVREKSYRQYKLQGMQANLHGLWERVNEWNMDNFLRGSSKEFRAVQEKLQQIDGYMQQIAKQGTYDAKQMQEMLVELGKRAGKYLDKKDKASDHEPRTKKEGDSYAERRYNFVLDLEKQANVYAELLKDEQMTPEEHLIAGVAEQLLQAPEFESYKSMDRQVFDKAIAFTLAQKNILKERMDDMQNIHIDKLADLIKSDAVKCAQLAEKTMAGLKKENENCNVSERMVEIFDDGMNRLKSGNLQSKEKTQKIVQHKAEKSMEKENVRL